MIALLIITSVGVILYGYMLMGRMDRFMERGGFAGELKSIAVLEREILLYGGRKTIDAITSALEDAAITYDHTNELEIKDEVTYHWVGAFSKDDESNLFICMLAKRKNESIRMMAKCNDMVYENIFRQMGVTVIFQNDISPKRILACLRG